MAPTDTKKERTGENGARFLVINLLLALGYGILAWLGLSFAIAGTGSSPVWPAAGFALGSLLLLGIRFWPGLFLGAVAAPFIDFLLQGYIAWPAALAVSLGTGAGAILEALAGFIILRYLLGNVNPFITVRGTNIFFTASFLIALISSIVGFVIRIPWGIISWKQVEVWFTWWMGDTTGLFVVTPFLFSLFYHRGVRWGYLYVLEYAALTVLFLVTGFIVLGSIQSIAVHPTLFFLLLPLLLWYVFRFSQREASLAIMLLSTISIFAAMRGTGPFVSFSVNNSLLLLQSFIGVMAFVVTIVNAYAAERERSVSELGRINADLDRIVRERTSALDESERRFRTIYNQSPLGIVIFDGDGSLIDLNPASLGIFGIMEVEDVLGMNLFNDRLVGSGDTPALLAGNTVRRTMIIDFDEIRREGRYDPKRSGIIHVEVEVAPVEGLGYLMQVKDITGQALAETALKENEKRLRTIFDNAGIGIMIVTGDFRCLDANSQWLAMSGYSREEMLELSILDITHPDDLLVSREHLHAIMAGSIDSYNIEKRYRKKDGSFMWGNLSVTPIRDSRGGITSIIAVIVDITRRKNFQLRLKENEEFLRRVIDTTPGLVFVKNSTGVFTLVNNALARIYGTTAENMIGKRDADFNPSSSEVDAFLKDDMEVMNSQRTVSIPEESVTASDGTVLWFQTTKVPIVDADGVARHILGVSADITMLKEAQQKLLEMATHDSLTGLPNRRMLNDRLGGVIARSKRNERLIALLFMDLDGFKEVNDSLGHDAGDELLRQVGRRLIDVVREIDLVSRMGGDEFTIVLESVSSMEDVVSVAERIIETIRQPFAVGGGEARVTTSIGISVFPMDGSDPSVLLTRADNAMYLAKNSGKNRYVFYRNTL